MRREPVAVTHLKRLAACLALGIVMALMIGQHEGSQADYGYAIRQALFGPRVLVFLGIGVVVYLLVTFWPRVTPYLMRPGVRPMTAGGLTVVASFMLLKWSDSTQIDGGKLGPLSSAAKDTAALDILTRTYFGSLLPALPWVLLGVVVLLTGLGIVLRKPVAAWSAAGVAVVAAFWGVYAQSTVRDFLGSPDHSTGAQTALLGFAAMAAAAVTMARTTRDVADTYGFIDRVFSWRPGFPLAVIGLLAGLVALITSTWFSPTNKNDKIFGMVSRFDGSGINALTAAYLGWLVWVLFVVAVALAAVSTYLRHRMLGWIAGSFAVLSLAISVFALHDFSSVAAKAGFDGATGAWQNIGAGAWLMCMVFTVLIGAGWIAAHSREDASTTRAVAEADSDQLATATTANFNKVLIFLVIAAALFYPPMATPFWQSVLVSQIGIYVLLAIGLNVVVGWAGLLDLGFIAFYAIGSYTTAYLVGALPVKPPEFLQLPPLAAIPFAIVICLMAGVMLGTPTLRLRGDYLAIMTLGFGEIIRIAAVNNPGGFTNGPRGAINIPHPEIKLGPIDMQWGLDALPYWYLLLFLVVLIVMLFRRLEHSRLGRAWAAIREDEVAAQATGINTMRVKLLAFAIGASTSGVAGVFFASQVGVISPDNFLLNNSILVVAYVVFGGMGSLPGAMAGAAMLTWLPEFLKEQVPAEDRQMWIGLIILIMMIFRPAGLIPAKRKKAELAGFDPVDTTEPAAVPAAQGS